MMRKMLEITTEIGCKLNCRYCPQKTLVRAYAAGEKRATERPMMMTFELFKTCIDKVPQEIDIHFSGMCEPWQNPDCTRMMCYAHEKGHRIHVFTTLVGMRRIDYLQMKKNAPETLVLHIPDAEGNSHFTFDIGWLQVFSEVMRDQAVGALNVHSFSCHGTVHPMLRVAVEASGLPVNSLMYDRAGNVESPCDIYVDQQLQGPLICRWCGGTALDKNVLLPDGTVLLCCMDYGMRYPLGNLFRQSYEDIDEGMQKKDYRERLSDETRGKMLCRSCYRAGASPEKSSSRSN